MRSQLDRLLNILAGHLLAAPGHTWPGADGMTTADVVTLAYPRAAAAAQVPLPATLARMYPDLADCLESFFSDRA